MPVWAPSTGGQNGGVGLVLGAGNISAIGPLDVLYELVAHNRTSILKLNPTFASLAPVLETALAPLIDFGALRITNGGAEVGSALTGDPRIGHVHITGSAITHDLIVWGAGEEAEERRAANTPKLDKEITSELGGVAPIIVVPGRVVPGRPALPGRARGDHAPAQRRAQLHRRPGDDPLLRVAPARGIPR